MTRKKRRAPTIGRARHGPPALPSTRVHISFFDRALTGVTPSYEATMRYWDNGVADDMKMNFGDFVMSAKLKEFAPQPRRC